MEHSSIKLSILICHLCERAELFSKLYDKLLTQSEGLPVQILFNADNGEKSVGAKRNELIREADGEYVCFVDDDDDIVSDYVSSILEAIKTEPDCVGIEGVLIHVDGKKEIFKHSIEYQCWYTGPDAYYRTPNHLNPIKRELVNKIMFHEIDFGEDQKFSDSIKRLLKTEVYIDRQIYIYKAGKA